MRTVDPVELDPASLHVACAVWPHLRIVANCMRLRHVESMRQATFASSVETTWKVLASRRIRSAPDSGDVATHGLNFPQYPIRGLHPCPAHT